MTQQKVVTLAPSESQEVGFEVTPTEAREYLVTVDELVGSFTALPPPPGSTCPAELAMTSVGALGPQGLILQVAEPRALFNYYRGYYPILMRTSGMQWPVQIPPCYSVLFDGFGYDIRRLYDLWVQWRDNPVDRPLWMSWLLGTIGGIGIPKMTRIEALLTGLWWP